VAALVDAFVVAWAGDQPPEELGVRLAEICAQAHLRHPELAFDDHDLVAAIAARCPISGVLAHLDRCRVDDLALAHVAGRGNAVAIATIEHVHHRTLTAICSRFTSPAHSIDDLQQLLREKLFVGTSPAIRDYAGQGKLDSWLRVTATRLFLDLGKRKDRMREQPASDDQIARLPDASDLGLEVIKLEYRAAASAAIEQATRSLSSGDRDVLRLHFVARLTIEQVAAALGIHRTTASRRLAKAQQQLASATRELLAERLDVTEDKLDEIFGLVVSRFDISIGRLLATRT
jgi:RNA polymerase sigma-70 factor